MDREILFRGKRADNGEWVEGVAFPHDNHGAVTIFRQNQSDGTLEGKEVIPETVGQYTGLTDKNDKKIFEGDIIKIPDNYDEFGINAGEVYEVYFAFGGFRLKPKYSKAMVFWLEDDATVEIIGNIHDNSDLLEVSE